MSFQYTSVVHRRTDNRQTLECVLRAHFPSAQVKFLRFEKILGVAVIHPLAHQNGVASLHPVAAKFKVARRLSSNYVNWRKQSHGLSDHRSRVRQLLQLIRGRRPTGKDPQPFRYQLVFDPEGAERADTKSKSALGLSFHVRRDKGSSPHRVAADYSSACHLRPVQASAGTANHRPFLVEPAQRQ